VKGGFSSGGGVFYYFYFCPGRVKSSIGIEKKGFPGKRNEKRLGLTGVDTHRHIWVGGVGMNNVELIFLLLLLPVIDPLLLCECRGGFFFFFIYFYFWNFSVASSFIPFPK
jgi:hypothetical protein